MKRRLIASFVAMSLVAGPALAATTTAVPAAKVTRQEKKAQKRAVKTAQRASARTAKAASKTN